MSDSEFAEPTEPVENPVDDVSEALPEDVVVNVVLGDEEDVVVYKNQSPGLLDDEETDA